MYDVGIWKIHLLNNFLKLECGCLWMLADCAPNVVIGNPLLAINYS